MANRENGSGATTPPLLLTPGPLTTSERTRQAARRDWGSRGADFIDLTARIRHRLTVLSGGGANYTAIPLQGSGTFAVEAMLGSMTAPDSKTLILENGAYGRRMAEICRRQGRAFDVLTGPENRPTDTAMLKARLAGDKTITHIAAVHVETTSGVLNPLADIAAIARASGRRLLVDAMSSFGGLEINVDALGCAALAASANKCLEGLPGLGFVLAETEALTAAAGHAPSLALDLVEQWRGFENNGQWRFTPPTQIVAALDAALDQLDEEGGPKRRFERYRANMAALRIGMVDLGFAPFLPTEWQAPIIATFLSPAEQAFQFDAFYQGLLERGFAIYPGKLTKAESFRIGCIGRVTVADIERLLGAIRNVLAELGVKDCRPQQNAPE